ERVKELLSDANAFRGNRMNQLKVAADALRSQIYDVVAEKRAAVIAAIEGRKTEILGSTYYANAATVAQESVIRRIDAILARLSNETQVAIILQTGATFEQDDYPALLSQLVESQQDENRSEEHTSELQSRFDLVCRLLLEKK